jgi:hypothetical protein
MIVFANRRLGPAAELLVSPAVAAAMLRATAEAAQVGAAARWEQELVRWLLHRASQLEADQVIDVGEIAWSPENFERQRAFVLRAIGEASEASEHARALRLWAQMIEAHPRDSVQFGRRWTTQPSI